ncbi:DUF2637 domain-containing protein, partial [Streptomyces sp. NPDC051561]|uniref:DUF2637 domain-containing protein n=1 Tax=Streptomyces sp. NPDC051561 TaxID=3365658 RepID=UPI00378EF2C8
MTDSHSALAVAPIGAWDRLAIVALGAAGCALSYDALQQMAVAIHVRGFLTYLFPLVIDGFIAYGVRALLVLAEAPLRARLYVWMLFGTATSASIWANALHAVRLNQQTTHRGLQLGDTVVAILSTLAPLALAGAVHLYILITRHHPADRPRTAPSADQGTGVRLADRSAAEDARDVPADSGPNSQPADQKRSGPASDNAATAAGSRKSSHPIETQADGPAAYSPEADRAANREANLQSDLALALPVPEASDHRTASATDQLAGPTDRTAT